MHRNDPGAIGPFRVVRRLGQGGMGAVYLVQDPASGAHRALKVLDRAADLDLRLRFAREAEAMARVDDHPGVLRVHGAGQADGEWFIVMEHAPGGDLAARLERGPLPPAEVVRLGLALARGLAHVHARGVLHRDLKPTNVLFDEAGSPRLADFGLARLATSERLTRTGALLGTPAYMAPEQVTSAAHADARADVYGLGAVLYHALTGRPPFMGPSALAVIERVLREPPVAPRQLVATTPAWLEAVILRALAKDPADRFASAAELAAALEARRGGRSPGRRAWPLVLVSVVVAVAALASLREPATDPTPTPTPTPTPVSALSDPPDPAATEAPPDVAAPTYTACQLVPAADVRVGAWLDDERVLTCGPGDPVRLLDVRSGRELGTWPHEARWVVRLDGDSVLLGQHVGDLFVLDLAPDARGRPVEPLLGERLLRLQVGGGGIVALTHSAVHLLDGAGRPTDVIACDVPPTSAARARDGVRVLVCHKPDGGQDVDVVTRLHDLRTRASEEVDLLGRITACDVSLDGRFVYAGTAVNQLLVIDVEAARVVGSLETDRVDVPGMRVAHRGLVDDVVASPDGRLLYSCSDRGGAAGCELRVWDLERRVEACAPLELAGGAEGLSLAPGGRALLLSTHGAGVHVVPLDQVGLPAR